MPNATTTVAKAIGQKDYPLAVLFMSVFVGFFFLQFHLSKILSLPENKKSGQKIWLNLNMWFLHTALPFGSIYQLADFVPPHFTLIMYIFVLLCSSFLFYLFVIDDLIKCWEIWRLHEDEHRLPENKSLDAGKLDYNSVSIWEKV
ncbi:hypothetical protein L1987_52381 [Smallanthus sonchifolius]|uniref:Uncharacterized protein n=1 Tax=Smallanthus sonchifolius TaxID=185202 RepID=A0ACB9ETQ1_9ASTR|nr:hypothetical protein L1987_52381 [Smallanthus sonchifolius]